MTAPFDEETWRRITDGAVDDLRALLRFDTTNPPGNETPAIRWIAQRLADCGIEATFLECEGRGNLVARIAGDGSGGGPLLLAGHVDVVPHEREHWTHDPFGGEIDGGYLYGRGAVDMKNMVVYCMTAMMLLRRAGIRPRRDVIFAAVSDEEEGCAHGSRFLVEQHPELVRAEYMLGEVGGFPQDVNGVRYYPIQVAEKGIARLRLTAHGDPGHASMPSPANAVVRLARAVEQLAGARLPQHRVESVALSLRAMAAAQKGAARFVLPRLLDPALSGFVLDRLLPNKAVAASLAATLSNTVTPTVLQAGAKVNVIPGSASALVDGRLLPGQRADDLVREVRARIGPDVGIEVLSDISGRESPSDDPLFRLLCDTIRAHDPTGVPVPYMIPGFTDAMWFGRLCERCYGFAPVQFPAGDGIVFSRLFHGHDERIHVDGFRWGVRVFWDALWRFVGSAA